MKKEEREELSQISADALTGFTTGLIHPTLNKDLIYRPFPWRFPCRQKILVVTDGYQGNFLNVSFSKSYFGLSAFIDTMLDQTDYFVNFQLTLAHRIVDDQKPGPADPGYARYAPNFENFRFDTSANDVKTNVQFDINHYDQIWLFGARDTEDFMNPGSYDPLELSSNEVQILTDWMENGGGLFATGDHAQLGGSLCRKVPRVSKMRLWENNTVDGAGNTVSPPSPTGDDRHDTLDKGHDSVYTFDDESDDIPMTIYPKWYYSWSFGPFFRNKHPHPVLCGKDGVIDILPDHPHEGEIMEASKVDITDTIYNGNPEFPQYLSNDYRPEVIAQARVLPDHTNTSDLNKRQANAKFFGAIGTYDGYKTDVGRVVVDSTWHHWFDVNLTGRPIGYLNAPPYDATNPKTQGFLATAAGRIAYSRIQNYFINVGLWLAPKTDRLCMLNGLLWHYVIKVPIVERFSLNTSIIQLGIGAKDALGKTAGQCNLRDWIFEVFPHELERLFIDFDGKKREHNLLLPTRELVEVYAFGGAVKQLMKLGYEIQDESPKDPKMVKRVHSKIPDLVAEGFKHGFDNLMADMKENMGSLKESMEIFDCANIEKTLKHKRKG